MKCNIKESPDGINVTVEGDTYTLTYEEAKAFAVKVKTILNRMGTGFPACDINSGIFALTAKPKEYTLLRSELLRMWYALKNILKIK